MLKGLMKGDSAHKLCWFQNSINPVEGSRVEILLYCMYFELQRVYMIVCDEFMEVILSHLMTG